MGDALAFVVIVALVFAGAVYLVPLAARRIVEREETRERGWLHDHVNRERKDPAYKRARRREPETEGDL